MLCAVAIIGAGYAMFAGDARTYNEGNSATAGYMTLTPGTEASENWDAISTSAVVAEFDSYKFKHESVTNVAYYADGATLVEESTSPAYEYYVKELGTAKAFTIENQTGAAITQVTFGAKAVTGTGSAVGSNADYKYFLKVSGTNTVYIDVDTATEKTGTLTVSIGNEAKGEITVQLCIGYKVNCYIPDTFVGDISATAGTGYTQAAHYSATLAPEDMKNISFAFRVADATPAP